MRFTGENVLNAPVEQVWDALLDPAVLVRTIPGCSRLETTGAHSYDMTRTAGVAAIRGTYAGTCRLSDLQERQSLRMDLQGAGAPGTIGAEVTVSFDGAGDGTTRVTYEADAVVGGMVGGVGQRMLTSVSRRMAGEFFANVDAVLSGAAPVVAPVTVPPAGAPTTAVGAAAGALPGQVFTAPPPPASRADDFLRGIAVGAGLVLAGVLAGAVAARRR